MDDWFAPLSVGTLLGTALVTGAVSGTLIGFVVIALWVICEWTHDRLHCPPHSEVAPTPPRRLNG
jgi:hypothetical protein